MACTLALTAPGLFSPVVTSAADDPSITAPTKESGGGFVRMPIIRKPHNMDILKTARLRQNNRDALFPHLLQKRQQSSSTYQAPLYNDQGSQYLVSISVGTPPQNFSVTLDTGSADLRIPSSSCDKQSCPFGGFNTGKSSTFQPMQEKFSIQYGIGSVNGTYVKDTVMVSGAKVPQQQFGLATYTKDILIPQDSNSGGGSTSTSASTVNANGILGLGYPQLTAATTQNNPAYTPFVFNLVQQGVIQEPVFSVYLNSASKQGWAGEIIFGGVDHSKYDGDLQYLPVAKLQSQPSPAPEGEGNGGGGGPAPGNGGDSGNGDSGNSGSGSGGSGSGGSGNDGSGNDGFGNDGSGSDGSGSGYGGYMDGGNPQTNNGSSLAKSQLLQIINFDNHNVLNPPLHQSDTGNTTSPNYSGYYYWMVYGQGIAVRNGVQSPEFKLQKPGAFILDTGSTLTYLPNDVAISIATAMAGSNGFQLDRQSGLLVVDCSTANSQATLELQMSTTSSLTSPPVTLSVKASELVIPLDGETAQSAKTCLFGIAPVGGSGALGPNMFLIGDSMLRSAYLVFDMGQNRVGIAAAKGMGGVVNGTGTASSGGGSSTDTSDAQSMYRISIASLWFGQLCLVFLFTVNLSPLILV
ncbi:unnamed protein product [Absidia cylindrospora]